MDDDKGKDDGTMFCSNCGVKLADGVNFCPECGTKVNWTAAADIQGDMVMLQSLGTCAKTTAAALFQNLCGYSAEEALLIADSAPITLARGLSEAQARFLAQALAEYGMEVSVYDGDGWRDWESNTTSVWDNAGELVTGVAAALGLLGLNNRISRDMMHRMDYPYRFNGARPPVYRLNTTLRPVSGRAHAPRPVVHRAPPPPPRPAAVTGPRNVSPRPGVPTPPAQRPTPAARPAAPAQRPAGPGQRPAGGPTRPGIPGTGRPGGSGRQGGSGRGR